MSTSNISFKTRSIEADVLHYQRGSVLCGLSANSSPNAGKRFGTPDVTSTTVVCAYGSYIANALKAVAEVLCHDNAETRFNDMVSGRSSDTKIDRFLNVIFTEIVFFYDEDLPKDEYNSRGVIDVVEASFLVYLSFIGYMQQNADISMALSGKPGAAHTATYKPHNKK